MAEIIFGLEFIFEHFDFAFLLFEEGLGCYESNFTEEELLCFSYHVFG